MAAESEHRPEQPYDEPKHRREQPYDEPAAAPVAIEPVMEQADATPPQPERIVYSSAPPPRTFQVVSEHDQVEPPQPQRPNRRRHHEPSASSQAQDLQLVETQQPVAQPASTDEDQPRRTRPRRRRGGAAPAEPLQLVETQGDAQAAGEDGATAQ